MTNVGPQTGELRPSYAGGDCLPGLLVPVGAKACESEDCIVELVGVGLDGGGVGRAHELCD